jgi:serine/threonine protein kinase
MRLFPPKSLIANQYQIIRLLGSNGTSAVYEARDTTNDTAVAIKHNGLPQQSRPWAKSAQQLTSLNHPALPSVTSYSVDGDAQFLVMEYIAGQSLEELLLLGATFSPGDVLHWADQLLDALIYVHSQRPPVLHGAIMPRNIKLTSRGNPILLDFAVLPASVRSNQARQSNAYTSPEQIQGKRLDQRSDVYALAATLYHLLSALPPADARTRLSAVAARQPDLLQPIHQHNSHVSLAVSSTIHIALSIEPSDRYSSASEFQSALCRARDGHAPIVDDRPRSREWGWRRWLAS